MMEGRAIGASVELESGGIEIEAKPQRPAAGG
jgi:hypothetical protein